MQIPSSFLCKSQRDEFEHTLLHPGNRLWLASQDPCCQRPLVSMPHQASPFSTAANRGLDGRLEGKHSNSNSDPEQQWHSPQTVGKVLNRPSLLRSSLSGKLHTLGSSPVTGERPNSLLNRVPSDPLLLQSIPTFQDEPSNQDLMDSRTMSASNLTREDIVEMSQSSMRGPPHDIPTEGEAETEVDPQAGGEPRKKRRGFWPFSGSSKDSKDRKEKDKISKDKSRKPSRSALSAESNGGLSDDAAMQLKQAFPSKSLDNSGGSISKKTSSIWRGRSFSKKGESCRTALPMTGDEIWACKVQGHA